jgi:hypothetical protein
MPESYLPNHPATRPGHDPEYGQVAPYLMADGDEFPCIIHQVKQHSDDSQYFNVVVSILWPPIVGGDGLTYPGEVTRSGKVYKKSTGKVLSSQCGPPWPG